MMKKMLATAVLATAFSGSVLAQETIRVGNIFADSGPFAPMIRFTQEPAVLAVEMLNAQGGALGRKYELVQVAHNGTPASVTAAVNRVVQQEKASFITGFSSSASSLALIPRLAGLNALMLEVSANSTELIGKSCNRNYFHLTTVDSMMINALRPPVLEGGAKTWNLLLPDYAMGHDFNKAFTSFAKDAGLTIQNTLFAPLTTTDFGALISQLRDRPAEGLVLVWPVASGSIAFSKQARQFGLFERYKSVVSTQFTNDMVIDAQGDNVAGIYAPQGYGWAQPGARNEAFVKAFEARFKRKPNFLDADVYQAFELLHAAILKAGSTDVAAVHDALASIKTTTIMGEVQMRAADQQLMRPMVLAQAVRTGEGKAEIKVLSVLPASAVVPPASAECRL